MVCLQIFYIDTLVTEPYENIYVDGIPECFLRQSSMHELIA